MGRRLAAFFNAALSVIWTWFAMVPYTIGIGWCRALFLAFLSFRYRHKQRW